MSDIYPITLARYNDWKNAGLTDEKQIYQIYDTDEDIAKELIRTRKALEISVDALKKIKKEHTGDNGELYSCSRVANEALEQITALEQKDK